MDLEFCLIPSAFPFSVQYTLLHITICSACFLNIRFCISCLFSQTLGEPVATPSAPRCSLVGFHSGSGSSSLILVQVHLVFICALQILLFLLLFFTNFFVKPCFKQVCQHHFFSHICSLCVCCVLIW